MASMQDIAARLGISKGTVSLVISGKSKGRVSDAVRERVLATAREMNYQPNEVARSLRTGHTNVIGVVVPDISNAYFGKLAFCIQEEAKKFGYLVLTANTNESDADLDGIVRMMVNRHVDGIIAVPTEHSHAAFSYVMDSHIPLVQLDRFCPGIKADYVGVNDYVAAARAVKALVDRGCRHIGMVGYDLNVTTLRERRRGCLDVLRSCGLFEAALIKDVPYDIREEDMLSLMRNLLTNGVVPDALYFTSRRAFTDSLRVVMQAALRAPDSLRVLCFDEVDPLLTQCLQVDAVRQPVGEMGTKAFDLLMDKMNGGKNVGNYLFEARLVMGR